ncbi:hypothetical protein [Pseudosulfitobacter pseudonitzschiae]|uniref:hypothetical protein n=1 Tax=Pseudosulfitobacter pseudonitzschiae TaxID=1402135 RepID=UPI003B7E9A79
MNIVSTENVPRNLTAARRLRHLAVAIWAALLIYALLFVDGPFLGMSGVLASVSFIWGIVALVSSSLAVVHFGVSGRLPKSIRRRRYEASLVLGNRGKDAARMDLRVDPARLPILTQGMILAVLVMVIFPAGLLIPLIIPALPFLAWIYADVREVMWLDAISRKMQKK